MSLDLTNNKTASILKPTIWYLIHWGLNKKATILQKTFWNAFACFFIVIKFIPNFVPKSPIDDK